MVDVHEWLKDEDSFRSRFALASERLNRLAEERRKFLRTAANSLLPLIERAERLGDRALRDDLQEIHAAALQELERVDAQPASEKSPLIEADSFKSAGTAALGSHERVTEEAREAETEPCSGATATVSPIPVETLPQSRPQIAEEAAPPVTRQAAKWVPRDRAQTEGDLEALRAALEQELPMGQVGLLRLKALGCKLRHLWAEQQSRADPQAETRNTERILRDLVKTRYSNTYLVWLDTTVLPEHGGHWETLSWLYSAMEPAMSAYTWLQENYLDLSTAEASKLLEGIGAIQQRLFRYLSKHFPGVHDEQQQALYEGLRTIGEELGHFINALAPSTSDAQLSLLSGGLEAEARSVRQSSEKRLRQKEALGTVDALLSDKRFGTRDGDDARLIGACAACLKAGVPPTRPEFRNALLPWESLLEEASDLEKLRIEVAKERERQEKKSGPPPDEPEDTRLSAETEAKRAKLLSITQGKTCLFIGGHPSDKHRQRLEQALELSALLWPELDRFDANPAKFASELKQSDVVVLMVNQMRKGMKAVKAHCKANGKQVVHLTHGYNVAQVIHCFDEQLNGSQK